MNTYSKFNLLLLISIFLAGPQLHAQVDCVCEDQFILLRDFMKENYPFYEMKVGGDRLHIQQAFESIIQRKASEINAWDSCISLLKNYADIFRDGHVLVRQKAIPLDKELHLSSPYSLNEILQFMESQDPIVGIWISNPYHVVIVPSSSPDFDYDGILIRDVNDQWKVNQVKFRMIRKQKNMFDIHIALKDHSLVSTIANLKIKQDYKRLYIDGYSAYTFEGKDSSIFNRINDTVNADIVYKRLSEKTFLIKAKTFGGQVANTIDSLTRTYHEEIIACENLILDVRNNGGGSDRTYYPILPYIYTGPVTLDGVVYYLSPEHKRLFRNLAQGQNDLVKMMESQADYSFFNHQKEFIHSTDTIYNHPLRVALLHNGLTISSGETFVTRARQSDRVTTYGVNTAGIVDGFNGNFIELGCIKLQYPTTLRSHRLPEDSIDPYGIAPDVYMPGFMDDPYPFIIEHVEQIGSSAKSNK